MFCPKCGTKNDQTNESCSSCGFNFAQRLKSPEKKKPTKQVVKWEGIGDLTITTNVDCKISLDGQTKGETKNKYLFIEGVRSGEHTIVADADDHYLKGKISQDLEIKKVELKLIRKKGRLKAVSELGPFTVQIAGKEYAAPVVINDLRTGTKSIKVKFENFEFFQTVEIKGNETTVFKLDQANLSAVIGSKERKAIQELVSMAAKSSSCRRDLVKDLIKLKPTLQVVTPKEIEVILEQAKKEEIKFEKSEKKKELTARKAAKEREFAHQEKLQKNALEILKFPEASLPEVSKKCDALKKTKGEIKSPDFQRQIESEISRLEKMIREEKHRLTTAKKKKMHRMIFVSTIIISVLSVIGFLAYGDYKKNLEKVFFANSKLENTIAAYEGYLEVYGVDGMFGAEAMELRTIAVELEQRIEAEAMFFLEQLYQMKRMIKERQYNEGYYYSNRAVFKKLGLIYNTKQENNFKRMRLEGMISCILPRWILYKLNCIIGRKTKVVPLH